MNALPVLAAKPYAMLVLRRTENLMKLDGSKILLNTAFGQQNDIDRTSCLVHARVEFVSLNMIELVKLLSLNGICQLMSNAM